MPWKDPEKRRIYRKKQYAILISEGYKRDYGKVFAICPICKKERTLSKNNSRITKSIKDEQGRYIGKCKSCSRVKEYCFYKDVNYVNSYNRKKRQLLKIQAIKYLGSKCIECGYTYNDKNAYAFDFHHRDPKEKEFTIAAKTHSFENVKNELDKCDLLCSICHRKKHSEEY